MPGLMAVFLGALSMAVPANQADLTALANFAGCPALNLPLPVPAGALPVGLQLIAAPGRDTMLLSAGAWIESCLQL